MRSQIVHSKQRVCVFLTIFYSEEINSTRARTVDEY